MCIRDRIGYIKYSTDGRKQTDLATESEIGQMRSVIGSMGWIARQCRPDVSLYVSQGQSAVSRATVKDLKLTNQGPEQAYQYGDKGLFFDSSVLSWDAMIVVTVTDASFA